MFFQSPPDFGQPFEDDHLLISLLHRYIPQEHLPFILADLKKFGSRVKNEMELLAQKAESSPPVHVPYDPWGKRVDEIRVSDAWQRMHEIAAEEGIVAIGYERTFLEFSRFYQFAKLYLFHPSSAIYSCPLAMTDGAARVIELMGTQDLKSQAFKHLTSRDPNLFWTSGQWMTEKTGGSDVSGTQTVAKIEGEIYRLSGIKWFTSATTSEMAMTLAKIEGEDKLSLFCVKLRDEAGNLQNIEINRLKDKLGTKALPTAELTLKGTPATLIGERGKGVKNIANLFNVTRIYNACCAVGYMKRALALSIDYSKKRKAFGKMLNEHGLHVHTLSQLQLAYEASMHLTFHTAYLLGRSELNKNSDTEERVLRLLIPLIKLYTAKMGVQIISEVVESFGGAGYIEDTGIPQILRNAQVLAIWEGTTNVLSLDVIRAILREDAWSAFEIDINARLNQLIEPQFDLLKKVISTSLQEIDQYLQVTAGEDLQTGARELAMTLARVYGATLLIEQARWDKTQRSLIVAEKFIHSGICVLHDSDASDRANEALIIFGK